MAKTHRASGRAVIIEEDKILLMKYKNGQYYNFPGGEVKEGETLAECAKREVLEESGISVVVNNMLFTLEVETKRCGIASDPHISVFFSCTVDKNVPETVPSEPDGSPDAPSTSEWVAISKLQDINFLPYIPANIIEYVNTGIFSPTFLSGQFEKDIRNS